MINKKVDALNLLIHDIKKRDKTYKRIVVIFISIVFITLFFLSYFVGNAALDSLEYVEGSLNNLEANIVKHQDSLTVMETNIEKSKEEYESVKTYADSIKKATDEEIHKLWKSAYKKHKDYIKNNTANTKSNKKAINKLSNKTEKLLILPSKVASTQNKVNTHTDEIHLLKNSLSDVVSINTSQDNTQTTTNEVLSKLENEVSSLSSKVENIELILAEIKGLILKSKKFTPTSSETENINKNIESIVEKVIEINSNNNSKSISPTSSETKSISKNIESIIEKIQEIKLNSNSENVSPNSP